jgi:hypothetical protein
MASAGEYRERIAGGMQGTGIVLMIGWWFSAIIGAIGAAVYAGWIVFTEGRNALWARGVAIIDPLVGYILLGSWLLVFALGALLAWIGGRMSANPKNRVRYDWKGLCREFLKMAQLAGLPFALYFLFLWLILRLDAHLALLGSFLLLGASLTLVEKNLFPGLSDRKSKAFVKNRNLLSLQVWFCGECNKHFLPNHWLIAASADVLPPDYVAQCPECKGGNTQICLEQWENDSEEAEARCKLCGSPPFSLACHRFAKQREEFWKAGKGEE